MLNRRFADFHGLLIGGSDAVYFRKNHKNQSLDCRKGGADHDHLSMLFRVFAVYIKLNLMTKLWLVVAAGALSSPMAHALESSADFEAEITKHGAKQFVQRICQSPEWSVFLNGVEKGDPGWLRIAGRIRPHTDAGCGSELETALITALPNSPEAVVSFLAKYRGPNGTFSVESVCGDKSLSEPAEYYQALLTALRSVKKPSLPRTMQLCMSAANIALERARQDAKP